MKARLVKFGEIEVEGKRYTHDVVIDGGKVRKRKKGPSKQFREKFGHTPLSAGERIPWGGKRLIVGTGAHIGSVSPAGGSEKGSGVRHSALHLLNGDPSANGCGNSFRNSDRGWDLCEICRQTLVSR